MAFSSWLTSSWFDTPSKPMTQEERVQRAIKHAESFGKEHKMIPVFTQQQGKSTTTIPNGASKLSHEELVDKIRGIIYGQAMGDAIGLYTEFHDREWCHHHYGHTPMTMNRSIRGWDVGDWTDDTDQMLLILDGMIRWNGDIKHTDFAHRLWYWVQHGYPELGDYSGNGCGGVVAASVRSDGFLTDPHACAREVYAQSNGRAAANGAVMRTSILGIPHFYDLQHVIKQTLDISNVTHADPRCAASVVACTTAIALMLEGVYDPTHPETMETVLSQAEKLATAQLTHEYDPDELHKHLNAEKLSDLELDDSAKIGYTYKCIGSGFWATRYGTNFRTSITELVLEGGDADTNGAVAGAMLGCKLGFKALPKEWLSTLANRDWLEHRITHFLKLLGLDDKQLQMETTSTSTSTSSCTMESTNTSASVPISHDTAASTPIIPDTAVVPAASDGMNTASTVTVPA